MKSEVIPPAPLAIPEMTQLFFRTPSRCEICLSTRIYATHTHFPEWNDKILLEPCFLCNLREVFLSGHTDLTYPIPGWIRCNQFMINKIVDCFADLFCLTITSTVKKNFFLKTF